MRRYIQQLQDTHTPHERRQVALRVATIVTAILFIGWLATLGLRLGGNVPEVAEDSSSNSAAVLEAVGGNGSN